MLVAQTELFRRVTVLIQGPLNQTTIRQTHLALRQGFKVVVSTWAQGSYLDGASVFGDFASNERFICKLSTQPDFKGVNDSICRDSTFWYAIHSIYYGIQEVSTEFVIKVRSDEFFERLDKIVEDIFLEKYEERFCFGNIFAKTWLEVPYHIGDHIFMCKASVLESAMSMLINQYKMRHCQYGWLDQRYFAAETIVMRAYLYMLGKCTEESRALDHLDSVHVFDVNKYKPFLLKWQHQNITYNSKFRNPYGVYSDADLLGNGISVTGRFINFWIILLRLCRTRV